MPVLSVVGTETERLFAASHDLLHGWLPQTEDCEIEDVAHLLHMQRPAPVARCVAGFFTRHPIGDVRADGPRIGAASRRAGTAGSSFAS